MARFHQRCSSDIRLSEDRTMLETTGWRNNVFSDKPLSPGDTFSVRVKEAKHPLTEMYLGVTELGPHEWRDAEREVDQENIWRDTDTYYIGTIDGERYEQGYVAGYCQEWTDKFGKDHIHALSNGDTLSVTLCEDKSLSFTYTNAEFKQIFTDLPDKPLWVVLGVFVQKLEIVDTEPRRLFDLTLRVISMIIDRENIKELPLPARLKNTITTFGI